jgi:hypothetical protein
MIRQPLANDSSLEPCGGRPFGFAPEEALGPEPRSHHPRRSARGSALPIAKPAIRPSGDNLASGRRRVGFVGWIVFGPGPTDFAGRDRVALSDYKLADPTDVPEASRTPALIARVFRSYVGAIVEAEVDSAGGRAFVLLSARLAYCKRNYVSSKKSRRKTPEEQRRIAWARYENLYMLTGVETLAAASIYSTNITPDQDTGIGRYTDKDFIAAVHRRPA